MFPAKVPWLFVLQLLVVSAVVAITLIITGNALALLGLLFIWAPPPFIPEQYNHPPEEDESAGIGFTADVDQG